MKKTQKGFSAIEAVLVLVIVALLGFVVWYVFHTKNSTDTTYGNAANVQTTPQTGNKSSSSAAKPVVETKTDSKVGQYLADGSGMPLYTYNQDTDNASNCSGSCLSNWPAYKATSTASLPANVGTITRSDGTVQYTYNKKPLYTFTGDSAGKVTGNGIEGFNIATP